MIYVLGLESGFLMSVINKLMIYLTSSFVGKDEFGNKYYLSKKNVNAFGQKKRYVLYGGNLEISNIPPMWHCWLHYMIDHVDVKMQPHKWMVGYKCNQTGSINAHKSQNVSDVKYKIWQPH